MLGMVFTGSMIQGSTVSHIVWELLSQLIFIDF